MPFETSATPPAAGGGGGTLAIIPARGGSKGIPRKNVRPVAGKPLIAWTIEAARAARAVDRVAVSTDDDEIADVAARYGAEVIRRPAEISGDTASSESALLHALEHLAEAERYAPELLVFLQCTSPLTEAADIDGAVRKLRDADADTALTVAPFHYFVWGETAGGQAVGLNHDKSFRQRRQDRDPQYLETGAVYVMRAAGFREARHRFFGRTALYPVPVERTVEIDEPADLLAAEAALAARDAGKAPEQTDPLPARVGAVVFDFDGVFTDNKVIVDQDGREAVACSRGDGMGVSLLRATGLPLLVLSKERNPVVSARCAKLKIECLQGVDDKRPALLAWLAGKGVAPADALYVGNDVNDLECLATVGCGVAVADAVPEAKAAARLILQNRGGDGAVREICDLVRRRNAAEPGRGAA